MSRRMLAKAAQSKGFGPQIPDPPRHTLGALGRSILSRNHVAIGALKSGATQETVPRPCS
jgi:hypothetical protein